MHNCSELDDVRVYLQKPQEKLDYKIDYRTALAKDGDFVVSSSWTFPDEILGSSPTFTELETKIFLKIDEANFNPYLLLGNIYKITNKIVTNQGREIYECFSLKIEDSC